MAVCILFGSLGPWTGANILLIMGNIGERLVLCCARLIFDLVSYSEISGSLVR